MAAITQTFTVRNGASSPPGARLTGLTPTWVFLKRLSDNGDITSPPTISEIAQGQYKFAYDAEANGEAAGQIDAGATVTNASDRYVDVLLTRDSTRIQAGISSSGQVVAASVQGNVTGSVGSVTAPVTLPAAPSGYGGASASDVATAMLATPANKLATNATGQVTLDMTQSVPVSDNTSKTTQNVGDALNAARAQGFGKWVLNASATPPTLTLYGPDGTTTVRVFTLDSAATPTQRS